MAEPHDLILSLRPAMPAAVSAGRGAPRERVEAPGRTLRALEGQ